LYPTTTLGRAILIPWSFGNLINLGLVVFAIYKSVSDIGQKNVVQKHYEHARERTIGRTVTTSLELERKEIEQELIRERDHAKHAARSSARSGGSLNTRKTMYQLLQKHSNAGSSQAESLNSNPLSRAPSFSSTERPGVPLTRTNSFATIGRKKTRLLLLRDEKERFDAMRKIQSKQKDWTDWLRLVVSMTIFAVFWLVGAAGFWALEADTLQLTYFESVYFCWVTLITLGYGDYAPKSWGGRCLYVIFVQFAVPSITILVNDLSTTIIAKFDSISNSVSTLFGRRKEDLRELVQRWTWLLSWIKDCFRRNKEVKHKTPIINGDAPNGFPRVDSMLEREKKGEAFASGLARPDTLDLVKQHEDDIRGKVPDAAALARQLALAIRRAARDMTAEETKRYTFEEWVEFTRLIRFTAAGGAKEALREEEDEGLVEWDWLAENSPMMAETSEAEFVLERLTESLVRYLRRNPPHDNFAETVRSQGEAALRLRANTHHEDDDHESIISPLSSPTANQRPNLASKLMSGNSVAQSLHPVEEEDHGHL
jgi:potassium channel subfamily K